VNHRGGEKVLEAICRIFPEADIFTLFYEPEAVSPFLRSRKIYASRLNPLRRFHRCLLPLMPMALESFDLRSYDLVISSESGPAKGILTSSTTEHFCYCHTPMRYLWELYPAYCNDYPGHPIRNLLFAPIANYLRTWDYSTAARVDGFMSNSRNVRRRIWKTWRRRSRVVYPPVATDTFHCGTPRDYSLTVSELVPYKRLDYAVRTFAESGRKLRVVGDGPEYKKLRKLAAPNVEFCGRVSDSELRDLYAHCSEFIVPGEEDFGITTVEALASGKPVVALARGGSPEIVGDGCGILYAEPNGNSLNEALRSLDLVRPLLEPGRMISQANTFSEAAFAERFPAVLAKLRTDSAKQGIGANETGETTLSFRRKTGFARVAAD
jgi:glycosyltransferase involved in cell wall biosynthesis